MQKLLQVFDKILTIVTVIAALLLVLKIFVFQQVNVLGQSMQPNFFEGQKLLLNKADKTLNRGEVVSVYETEDMARDSNLITKTFPSLSGKPIKFLLKRVIALPNEEIEILGSKVIIYNQQNPNGLLLQENYISEDVKNQMEKGCPSYGPYIKRTKVPANHYYLMGDNRCNSLDSRDLKHGPFDISLLLGGVIYRYWPLEQAESIPLGTYQFVQIDPRTEQELEIARNTYL